MVSILLPYVLGRESPIPYLFEGITPYFDKEFQFRSLTEDSASLPEAVSALTVSPDWRARTIAQYVRLSLSDADLIHTGAREAHRHVLRLAKLRNPDIAHVHSFRVDINPESKFDTSMRSKLARQADSVTAVSEHTAETVRNHVGVNAEVIYNGVDTEWFHPDYDRPALFEKQGLDGPVFVYIGSMERRKRPDHVLAVAEALPEVSFLLVGDGPMLDNLRVQAADLNNVALPGRVAKNRLPAVYANARALLFPSVREGCPNVVLESMAAGTPVIGYRATSMPELIDHGETGLLAPVEETDALVDHVHTMINGDAPRMGAAARSYVHKNHTFESIATGYESIYRELL